MASRIFGFACDAELLHPATTAVGIELAFKNTENRQKHRNDNAAYNDCQEDNHHRFKKRSQRGHSIFHLLVAVVGDFHEHFRERAGLFAHVHHAADHGRENPRSLERVGDRSAFLHVVMNF